jgi:hypothetical protein
MGDRIGLDAVSENRVDRISRHGVPSVPGDGEKEGLADKDGILAWSR